MCAGAVLVDAVVLGVILIGLLHGLEPGHGWPVAFLYSIRKGRPLLYGVLTSSIISFFHFISSIVVVVAYILLSSFIYVPVTLLSYISATILVVMAAMMFRAKTSDEGNEIIGQHGHIHENHKEEVFEHEHKHEHPGQKFHTHIHKHTVTTALSLGGIAVFAAVLGFAHEEEFALLGLAVGGVDPLALMLAYAFSVTLALMTATLLCVKAYERVHYRIRKYEKYIPKISALTLLVMAFAIVIGIA